MTVLVVVTKILLIRPDKLIIVQRARPVLLVLALRPARRSELGRVPLHRLVLADVAEGGAVVAVVEAAASLQLHTTFISLNNLFSSCPVHVGLCLVGDHKSVVVDLLSV